MSKVKDSTEPILTKTVEDTEIVKYEFPENISLKSTNDFVDGEYLGLEVKAGEGLGGTDLIIAHFRRGKKTVTAVVGAQAVKFLKNFKSGHYLKIIRVSTNTSKKTGLPFAQYSFEFKDGFDLENTLIQADQIKPLKLT